MCVLLVMYCQTCKHSTGVLITRVSGLVWQWVMSFFPIIPSRYDKNLTAYHCPIWVTVLHVKIYSAHSMNTLQSYNIKYIADSIFIFLRLQILMQSCKLMHKHMLNFEVMHIVLVIFVNQK